MKKWFSKYKNTILKLFILILIAAGISVLSAFILYLFGVISFQDGLHFNEDLFKSFSTSWYGALISQFVFCQLHLMEPILITSVLWFKELF